MFQVVSVPFLEKLLTELVMLIGIKLIHFEAFSEFHLGDNYFFPDCFQLFT